MNNKKFYIEDYLNELKQHINLSENAWLTIEEDIKNFYLDSKKESFSGFLNTIFKNFYEQSEASISLRYLEKEEELKEIYSKNKTISKDKKLMNDIIKTCLKDYEDKAIAKALSYPKGTGQKFRINKENLNILRDLDEADYYNNSIGLYLKAIYEEYVLKPFYIREQIFFKDIYDEINNAIKNERKLKISLSSKITTDGKRKYIKKFYVLPYKIVQDKTKSYNYLIGFSEEIKDIMQTDENGKEYKTSITAKRVPACFRLSRIETANVMSSMGAHISKENKNELDKQLIERTAMYISSETISIKIKFTDKGLESFKRNLYMRPQFYEIDKNNKHIYTFRCTELQAINYFFKMGWDANIIEPESLKEKFIQRYSRAIKSYQGMSKQEIYESEKSKE